MLKIKSGELSSVFLDRKTWKNCMSEDVMPSPQYCKQCGEFFIEAIGEMRHCPSCITFDAVGMKLPYLESMPK